MSDRTTTDPLALLRDRTGDLHDEVETRLGEAFFGGDSLTPGDFRELLGGFYRVYHPLEPPLQSALERHLPDYPYRARTPELTEDLVTLGLPRSELDSRFGSGGSPGFSLDGTPRVLGCLYVIEGSEMGKKVIRRQLERKLPEMARVADCFFHPDSDDVSRHWKTFQSTLDESVRSEGDKKRLVETARRTFEWFMEGFS